MEFIKGIIIGIAKIIPGLSGAVLMISFNLYDKAIDSITNFFDNTKKNFYFLFKLGVGIVIGIVLFSKVISFCLTNYYLYTTSLFIGLIIGGIPIVGAKIKKDKKSYLIIVISFLIATILMYGKVNYTYIIKNNYLDYLIFFIAGLLEAIGTVLPGISSTALLMLLGIYNYYIETLGNILNLSMLFSNLSFIIPFGLGLFIGIILISLLVNYLFKHYESITFSLILGFSFSSIFILILGILKYIINLKLLIVSLIFLIIGSLITINI